MFKVDFELVLSNESELAFFDLMHVSGQQVAIGLEVLLAAVVAHVRIKF